MNKARPLQTRCQVEAFAFLRVSALKLEHEFVSIQCSPVQATPSISRFGSLDYAFVQFATLLS